MKSRLKQMIKGERENLVSDIKTKENKPFLLQGNDDSAGAGDGGEKKEKSALELFLER